MQMETKKEKIEEKEEKELNYIPMYDPTANERAYRQILEEQREIMHLVIFTDPDPESREGMATIRKALREHSCNTCTQLGQLERSKMQVPILVKDEVLTSAHKKLVLIQEYKQSTKCTMACLGCKTLKLKQIATGFIKGRRFKQI